jgi:hypothetical protein
MDAIEEGRVAELCRKGNKAMTRKPWWMRSLGVILVAWGLAGPVAADPGGFAPPAGRGGVNGLPVVIGGPNTLLGAGDLPPGRGPDRYGLHPCLKKFFHIPPGGRCGPGCDGTAHAYGPFGPHGTLVFPHHPFARSPRDFFMLEPANGPTLPYALPSGR